MAQGQSPSVSVNKKKNQNTNTSLCLHIIDACFCVTIAELNYCDRDRMTPKT